MCERNCAKSVCGLFLYKLESIRVLYKNNRKSKLILSWHSMNAKLHIFEHVPTPVRLPYHTVCICIHYACIILYRRAYSNQCIAQSKVQEVFVGVNNTQISHGSWSDLLRVAVFMMLLLAQLSCKIKCKLFKISENTCSKLTSREKMNTS